MYIVYDGSPAIETIWKYARCENCSICDFYKGAKSVILSAMRMGWQNYNFLPERIWLAEIDQNNDNESSVIVFMDSCDSLEGLRYHISYRNPNQRFVFYYWNRVSTSKIHPEALRDLGYELWSFDPDDCERYNLKFNPSFYCESWYDEIGHVKIKADVSFVGRDQYNRMKMVDPVIDELRSHGITATKYVTAPKWYKRFSKTEYRRYLNYKEVVATELEGRAVLDCAIPGQRGITLRIFDALCNGRKLITTNQDIINYKFYDPAYIFVMGRDDINVIGTFLADSPLEEPIYGIEDYSIENWLKRFD